MLDINRDGIKLETPEMNGLVKNIFLKWDPQVTVDCHTTNGSYHEEPVTFSWMMNPAGDRSMTKYMEKQMMPAVANILRDQYKVENCFYGEFIDMKYPEKGWEEYASEPRYMTNYIGVRNRLAIGVDDAAANFDRAHEAQRVGQRDGFAALRTPLHAGVGKAIDSGCQLGGRVGIA